MKFKSPRMERVYKWLDMVRISSTKEIEDKCEVASARDYIRRLRDAGCTIRTIEAGTSKTGARIVNYELIRESAGQLNLL